MYMELTMTTIHEDSSIDATKASSVVSELVSETSSADSALFTACRLLEQARCLETEREAWHLWTSHLLSGLPFSSSDSTTNSSNSSSENPLPGGIVDAWKTLATATHREAVTNDVTTTITESNNNTSSNRSGTEYDDLAPGQYSHIIQKRVLHNSLLQIAKCDAEINKQRQSAQLQTAVDQLRNITISPSLYYQLFQQRNIALQQYHAQHDSQNNTNEDVINVTTNSSKRQRRQGHLIADGYDLSSTLQTWILPVQDDTVFSPAEVCGKYFDLEYSYNLAMKSLSAMFKHNTNGKNDTAQAFTYLDFLQVLLKGLEALPESTKLQYKAAYSDWLDDLQKYLMSFIQRTAPLWTSAWVEKYVLQPARGDLQQIWSKYGGYLPAYKNFANEIVLATTDNTSENEQKQQPILDLHEFASVEDLSAKTTPDQIKLALQQLGLKCGGTPLERVQRLWMTKDTPLDQLPKKLFAKKGGADSGTALTRYTLAKKEIQVVALLNAWRPTLQATVRQQERHSTQTLREREKEIYEELYTGFTMNKKGDKGNYLVANGLLSDEGRGKNDTENKDEEDEEYDEDDEPVYNPKNVPLDWDGKPIPYWLFKLHGLQHYYPCEICGGESYRGRRNFELHFAEAKHSMGMKALGIPNTKHFHGVTSISDAQELWKSLQNQMHHNRFDNTKEEEYEDSHGNVLTRTAYEDLARQGLL